MKPERLTIRRTDRDDAEATVRIVSIPLIRAWHHFPVGADFPVIDFDAGEVLIVRKVERGAHPAYAVGEIDWSWPDEPEDLHPALLGEWDFEAILAACADTANVDLAAARRPTWR